MARTFGAQLRKVRLHCKLTQAQAARLLGCAPPRISEWERSVRTPKLLTQDAIFMRLKKGRR